MLLLSFSILPMRKFRKTYDSRMMQHTEKITHRRITIGLNIIELLQKTGSSDKCVLGFMNCLDFELEEFKVSEAVGLSFHGFDFVIGAFKRPGGDRIIIPGENATTPGGKSIGELLLWALDFG